MSEIYWIQRLDNLHVLFILLCVLAGALIFSGFLCWTANDCDETGVRVFKKCFKPSILPVIIGILGLLFVPTTNEAYVIWGVGGTLDYVKGNKKVQELPDKVVDCLNLWVDNLKEKAEDKK